MADVNPCDENAVCKNRVGDYTCTCREGYTGEAVGAGSCTGRDLSESTAGGWAVAQSVLSVVLFHRCAVCAGCRTQKWREFKVVFNAVIYRLPPR